ncbi:lysostaphin resistance A-like protein [Pseudonocardia sp.]|jgi:membrane protease YdiL (CAAX protease family)|uniref:lysostaphin resistance A-like protein n=1 Tax=Pseudonocardia sp. TaxID=60912 RepID=UPI0031FBB3C6
MSLTVRRPIAVLLVSTVSLTLAAQAFFLLNGWNVMPAKVLELILLLGGATLLTALAGGRPEVRRLFAGLTRWRIGVGPMLMVVVALPLLTMAVGAATGSLQSVEGGWVQVAMMYLLFLVFGAITANLWEETVWGGFVQRRLMARHGLLIGSLLTAVPFFVIHLPLAFESKGWSGTSWSDALATWGILLLSAPFFRYLIGMVLIDTGGSLLAAGLLHASFNASGALPILSGGWQYVPAMILLTVAVAVLRRRHRRSTAQATEATARAV